MSRSKTELILRIGRDEEVKALRLAHTKPFDITGRPRKGWIMVKPLGYKTDTALRKWLKLAVNFVGIL